jgi:hypothetical protein
MERRTKQTVLMTLLTGLMTLYKTQIASLKTRRQRQTVTLMTVMTLISEPLKGMESAIFADNL